MQPRLRLRIRSRWKHPIDKSASRTSTLGWSGTLGWSDSSIPPLRNQPAALIGRHLIFLDRSSDGGLFVRRIVDDADQLRGRPLDVVDAQEWGSLHRCILTCKLP